MKLQHDENARIRLIREIPAGVAFVYESPMGEQSTYLRIKIEGAHGGCITNLHLPSCVVHSGLDENAQAIAVPNPTFS